DKHSRFVEHIWQKYDPEGHGYWTKETTQTFYMNTYPGTTQSDFDRLWILMDTNFNGVLTL
ncbi:MAG: hypothetical protein ACKO96_04185, partial [Flammeovirgaceae bacterium]